MDGKTTVGEQSTTDLFHLIENRRSIRRFKEMPLPEKVLKKAFEMAVLAPNSSNAQTWDFYRVCDPERKKKLRIACHNQTPARTASELIVVTANPKKWKRSVLRFREFLKKNNAPKSTLNYYGRTIPFVYSQGLFNIFMPLKKFSVFLVGLFRPINRKPLTIPEMYELCSKSAAIAAENFILAIEAQGYQSCMMEGFDENRVKKAIGLTYFDRVVMVIAVGIMSPDEELYPRFRIPIEEVVHEI